MVRISQYRYQKAFLLLAVIIFSYYFFNLPTVSYFYSQLDQIGYIFAVISGMLLSFGFTLPMAIGSLMILHPSNLALGVFLALAGCTMSNIFIYHFFNDQFMSEFGTSQRNFILRRFDVEMKKGIFERMKIYLACTFVGLVMSLPISEKTETLVLSGFREIETSNFVLLGILLNAILIFLLVLF